MNKLIRFLIGFSVPFVMIGLFYASVKIFGPFSIVVIAVVGVGICLGCIAASD